MTAPLPPVLTAAVEDVPVDTVRPHPENPREGDVGAIVESIEAGGWWGTIIAQRSTGHIVVGSHRWRAARALGYPTVPVQWVDVDDDRARRIMLADNRANDLSTYNTGVLADLLTDLATSTDAALAGTLWSGDDLDQLLADLAAFNPDTAGGDGGRGGGPPITRETLRDRFLIPPMSVLNGRDGWWRDRAARWKALGIRSEQGRAGDLIAKPGSAYYGDRPWQQRGLPNAEFEAEHLADNPPVGSGTSTFDPVLCEVVYRWFVPPGGRVLDPFAGGSVRGIVAAALGLPYTGVDLRAEQVAANDAQWETVGPALDGDAPRPAWLVGDAVDLAALVPDGYDFVLSCPPYADLEVYSDDPRDLSTMGYDDFLAAYRRIVAATVDRLAPDRFACFVVGDVRDRHGMYRGFVPDTIRAFVDAGAALYNEMILVTPLGSLPVRVARFFTATRKVGKTHQNVLVFVKGDPRAAVEACGDVDVEVGDPDPDVAPDEEVVDAPL